MKRKLYIIRGWPGSGKSTKAKQILSENPSAVHYEADMFFINEKGEYKFDSQRIGKAHVWCQNSVRQAMIDNKDVIVSNTFVKLWEMQIYRDLASKFNYDVEILTMTGEYKNVHNVPVEKVEQMKKNFQQITE